MYVLRAFRRIGVEWTTVGHESRLCGDHGVVQHIKIWERWSSEVWRLSKSAVGQRRYFVLPTTTRRLWALYIRPETLPHLH